MPEAEQRESDNLRLSCRLLDEHAGKGMPKLERLRVLHLRLNLLAKEGLLGPDRARSLWDATQVCMHSMSSIGEDQDPETMEEKAETLQMYAACCSLEFARGGNVAESKRLAVMAGGRARTGANEEMWSTLDDLKKLRYVSEEERIAWEEHLLAELGVAMRLGRSDK